jgi:hypothetical protein
VSRQATADISHTDFIIYLLLYLEGAVKFILWHADPLLGNDREISKYTRAVAE